LDFSTGILGGFFNWESGWIFLLRVLVDFSTGILGGFFYWESCLDWVEVGVDHEVVGAGEPELPERVERARDVRALLREFTLQIINIKINNICKTKNIKATEIQLVVQELVRVYIWFFRRRVGENGTGTA
jgi:hypothetical protein